MKRVKYLFLVLILLLVFILLVQNNESFSTKIVLRADLWFLGQYSTPAINIYLISFITFVLSLIIVWIYDLLEIVQLKNHIKKLKKEIVEKDKELNSLRNLPIVSESVMPSTFENDEELT